MRELLHRQCCRCTNPLSPHPHLQVTVATAPTFTSPTSASAEATTPAGAIVAGIYTPTAIDYTGASLTSSIQTFLVSSGAPIQLSVYVFPLGSTLIRNSVTNSAGLTAEQTVNITVVDTTSPNVTVAAPAVLTIAQTGTVNYTGKVGTRLTVDSAPTLPVVGQTVTWLDGYPHPRLTLGLATPRRPPLPHPSTVHGHRPRDNGRYHHLQPGLWGHRRHRAFHRRLDHRGAHAFAVLPPPLSAPLIAQLTAASPVSDRARGGCGGCGRPPSPTARPQLGVDSWRRSCSDCTGSQGTAATPHARDPQRTTPRPPAPTPKGYLHGHGCLWQHRHGHLQRHHQPA